MSRYDYDLFTIGAGSGGVRASRLAGAAGLRVAVCEESRLGGTCVNLGCIPKKLLSYAAHYADDFEDARGFGWDATRPSFSWSQLVEAKDREIGRLNDVYGKLLKNHGVDIVPGRGLIVDPHTVEVEGTRYTSDKILVATGSRPKRPEFQGGAFAIVSDEAFHLDALPKRTLVLGGGYIALEFAGILSGLGSKVTLLHRGERLLRGFDEDIQTRMQSALAARGIVLKLNAQVRDLRKTESGLEAQCSDGVGVPCDQVLAAIGRVPNTDGLGLKELGVTLDARKAVVVNEYYQSTVPSIFALGDVIDRVTLTPVALSEASAFVSTQFGDKPVVLDYGNIPSAVFSQPPIASVGFTEANLKGDAFSVYTSEFLPLRQTLGGRDERSFMKMLVDQKTDRVLGCHMIGPDAPEIMQGLAVALRAGVTKKGFDATVGIHPTAAEEFVTMRSPRR